MLDGGAGAAAGGVCTGVGFETGGGAGAAWGGGGR